MALFLHIHSQTVVGKYYKYRGTSIVNDDTSNSFVFNNNKTTIYNTIM